MEEQILHYYSKVFSILIIVLLIFFFIFFNYSINKKIELSNDYFSIKKGEEFEKIFKKNVKDFSAIDIFFLKVYYLINNYYNKEFIHYGEFYIENKTSLLGLLNIITKPGNKLSKITIVEGWSHLELNKELSKYFDDYKKISFEEIIADTYYFHKNINFESFKKYLTKFKDDYFDKNSKNELNKYFSKKEIMIIGSLIEKEGLDKNDKKKISSVIFNRLNKNMKLQIDATVLYAITQGEYDLKRKLMYKDLKVEHPFNTYNNIGLPPKPISYVGKNTLDIIFENYKTEFLFYFFDNSLNRHKFSKTYKEHKAKLDEYRKNQ